MKNLSHVLLPIGIVVLVSGIFFLTHKLITKKWLLFIYSMFSLAGILTAFIVQNSVMETNPFHLGQFFALWLFCSLPLIIYSIHIAIFRGKE